MEHDDIQILKTSRHLDTLNSQVDGSIENDEEDVWEDSVHNEVGPHDVTKHIDFVHSEYIFQNKIL